MLLLNIYSSLKSWKTAAMTSPITFASSKTSHQKLTK
jgi:hypothetical protein